MNLSFISASCMVVLAACSPSPNVEVIYEPYEGEAFPDRGVPVAYPLRAALVTDSLGDTLSVVDLGTGQMTDQRPVGRNPVDVDGPHHVVIHPDGRRAFVALSYPETRATGPHATHGSSIRPGYVQTLALTDLKAGESVRVDANPGDIVISPDGGRIWVSHFDLNRAVQNPTDLEKARARLAYLTVTDSGVLPPTFVAGCVAPHGVLPLDNAGDRVAVACYGEDAVALVDLSKPEGQQVSVHPVGPGVVGFGTPSYGPYALLASPDGSEIVVSNTASKEVRFFVIADLAVDTSRTIPTLGAPYFPAYASDGRLVIPTQQPDGLLIVDPSGVIPDETVFFDKATCELPHEVMRADSDLFVVCEGDHVGPGAVLKLAPDFSVSQRTLVGIYPDALRVLPAGVGQ